MRTLLKLKSDYRQGKISKTGYIKEMYKIHKYLFEYSSLISETDLEKIEITDQEVIWTIKKLGIKMSVMKNDYRSTPLEIFNFNRYEKDELELSLKLIQDNFVVFDIGANIGWYTIIIGKLRKNLQTFSFEPIPQTFKMMKKNIRLNNLENVIPVNSGLSDSKGKFIFYFYPEGTGNASFKNLSDSKHVKKIIGRVTTLDNFVKERKTKIDFIKCDVEGAELFVFQGGVNTISKFKPVILTEMLRKWSAKFKYHPNDIINFLKNLGYQCFTAKKGRLKTLAKITPNTPETNFFFLHAIKHANLIKTLT